MGSSGILGLGDSSGRTHIRISSDPFALNRGTLELAENFSIYETGGETDNSIDVNFDFETGPDKILNITPNSISYDGQSLLANGSQTASEIPFTPNGSISSTNVQDAINEVRDEALAVSVTPDYSIVNITNGMVLNTSHISNRTNGNVLLVQSEGDTRTLTVDNIDANVNMQIFADVDSETGVAIYKEGTASFFGKDMNGDFKGSNNAVRITAMGDANGVEKTDGNIKWSGHFEWTTILPDPTDNASYIGRFDPSSIDANAFTEDATITVWNNLNTSGVGDMTINNATLHLESAQRQLDLSGQPGSFGSLPAASTNFLPGTDEWTLAGRIGHEGTNAGAFEVIFGRVGFNDSATGQYFLRTQDNRIRAYVGGTRSPNLASPTRFDPGDTFVFTVRTTGMDLYVNNVKVFDNEPIGTSSFNTDFLLGSRFDGNSFNFGGSFSHFYIKNQAIDTTEATSLHNFMRANQ